MPNKYKLCNGSNTASHSSGGFLTRRAALALTSMFLLIVGALVAMSLFPTPSFADNAPAKRDGIAIDTAPQTSFTVIYNEHYFHDEYGNAIDGGTRVLGERTFPATVGDKIDTWDYVANIPGFFFFDGWPNPLVVKEDPKDNVIELFYVRLSNYSYKVKYYAMTGADLTASNWKGALATNPTFHYLGAQTVGGQLFGKTVLGSSVAYSLADAYTVGTWPPKIQIGTNDDDNVINVLYVPKMVTGPDSQEIEEKPETMIPDEDAVGDPDENENGEDAGGDNNENTDGVIGDVVEGAEGEVASDEGNLPDATTPGEIEITDEMIATGPGEDEAQPLIESYDAGRYAGAALAQAGDKMDAVIIGLVLVVLVAGVVIVWQVRKARKERKEVSSSRIAR